MNLRRRIGEQLKKRPGEIEMTLTEMDADLAKYDDFEQLSNRVPYWERRFHLGASKRTETEREAFDALIAKHANRALGVMRAG